MAHFATGGKVDLGDLDEYLLNSSYIQGYSASQFDVAVFNKIAPGFDCKKLPSVARWFNHIASFSACERCAWPGKVVADEKEDEPASPKSVKSAASSSKSPKSASAKSPKSPAKPKAKKDDDFDFDDDDSDDEGGEKLSAADIIARKKAEAEAATHELTGGKSSVIFDVKPWGLETDMNELEKNVRAIEMKGLRWAGGQFEKVAFGIRMLRINAVVEDDYVSIDELQERMEALEDFVQSTDIYAFNKL